MNRHLHKKHDESNKSQAKSSRFYYLHQSVTEQKARSERTLNHTWEEEENESITFL